VPALVEAIARHRAWLERSGCGEARVRALAARRILRVAAERALRRARAQARRSGQWAALVEEVAGGRLSPAAAADQLLDGVALEATL
jgi:putative protein kinase ArgK-like GTPase of G3E family